MCAQIVKWLEGAGGRRQGAPEIQLRSILSQPQHSQLSPQFATIAMPAFCHGTSFSSGLSHPGLVPLTKGGYLPPTCHQYFIMLDLRES